MTKYLLIALILSLGFGQLLRFEIGPVPIYLHDVLVVLILLNNLRTRIVARDYRPRIGNLQLPLLLLGLGLATGWLVALGTFPLASLGIPFLYTLRLLAYLTLYLAVRRTPYAVSPTYFLLSGLVAATIGYVQYFLLPDMRWAQYLGWDDHLYRLTLPHFDPTFTGVMLGLALLTAFSSSGATRNSLLLIRYSACMLPALLLTYARSVWVSLVVTIISFNISKQKYLRLGFGICILVVSVFLLPQKTGEGTNLLRTFSITSRVSHDVAIIRDLNWRLVTGVGFNTFGIPARSAKGYPLHATGPNNSYLAILATMGLSGLIGWGLLLYRLYQSSSHRPVLIFLLLTACFNNVLLYPFALLYILLLHATTENSKF